MAGGGTGDSAIDELRALGRGPASADEKLALAAMSRRLFEVEPKPLRLGRYEVRRRVGAGGVGTVYLAHDPRLARDVAIKVLRDGGDDANVRQQRLRREARALAQLSHPNIVPVFAVARADPFGPGLDASLSGALFIVMEYVPGQTLRQWLEEQPRSWADVVARFLPAADALAAAHRRGITHRDFKPDNVLVGADGRVRVVDFGLATGDPGASVTNPSPGPITSPDLAAGLSATGTIAGTPLYMAPEQLAGKAADPRADQYAFFVSLYQGLCGDAPFAASSSLGLQRKKMQAEISWPVTPVIPRWLRGMIRRGLAPEPGNRFAGMDAVVAGLRRRGGRGRRIAGVTALVGVAAVGALATQASTDQIPCDTVASREIRPVWDRDGRGRLVQVLGQTGHPYADATAQRVSDQLDRYADGWTAAWSSACADARADDPEADRRLACLRRRRDEIATTVAVIAEADRSGVPSLVDLVLGLTPIDRCSADAGPQIPMPTDPALAAEVESLRSELQRAEALRRASRRPESAELAAELLPRAEAVGYLPVLAEAQYALGSAVFEDERAEELLEAAVWSALGCGDDDTAARAGLKLISHLSMVKDRVDDALAWKPHVEAALTRLGEPEDLEIQLWERSGMAKYRDADYDGARVWCERAHALLLERYEPHHPKFSATLQCLAGVEASGGHYEEALGHSLKAIKVTESVYGPGHRKTATPVLNAAATLGLLRRYGEAITHAEQALAIFEAWGDSPAAIGDTLNNLGFMYLEVGRVEDAEAAQLRALEIRVTHRPPGHRDIVQSQMNLGRLYMRVGEHDQAVAFLEIAAQQMERQSGDGCETSGALDLLGHALLGHGDAERAYAVLSRAVEMCDKKFYRALAQVHLAQAIWDSGRDRQRALTMARDARDVFAKSGEGWQLAQQQEAEAWIASVTP